MRATATRRWLLLHPVTFILIYLDICIEYCCVSSFCQPGVRTQTCETMTLAEEAETCFTYTHRPIPSPTHTHIHFFFFFNGECTPSSASLHLPKQLVCGWPLNLRTICFYENESWSITQPYKAWRARSFDVVAHIHCSFRWSLSSPYCFHSQQAD